MENTKTYDDHPDYEKLALFALALFAFVILGPAATAETGFTDFMQGVGIGRGAVIEDPAVLVRP